MDQPRSQGQGWFGSAGPCCGEKAKVQDLVEEAPHLRIERRRAQPPL